MLPTRTLSVHIRRPPEVVYAFVSDPTHLPVWAPAFCLAVRRDDDQGWVVETPQGPVGFRFVPPNALGVLDHYVQPATGPEVYVPMRVIANQGGTTGDGSEVLFTLFQTPDMSDEGFAADARLVERDLAHLRTALET